MQAALRSNTRRPAGAEGLLHGGGTIGDQLRRGDLRRG